MSVARTIAEQDAFLLEYVAAHEIVSGWDWPADLAWARFVGDLETAELISAASRGGNILQFQLIAYESKWWRRVYRGRMRAMLRLVKDRRLFSYWSGMPSSVTGGASRTKTFVLGDSDHARTMRRLMRLPA